MDYPDEYMRSNGLNNFFLPYSDPDFMQNLDI